MAVPVALIVSSAIEAIKLGSQILETWQNNPEDQAEMERLWTQMQSRYKAASDAWEASKDANGQ